MKIKEDWNPPKECRCGQPLTLIAAMDVIEGWTLTAACDVCVVHYLVDWPFEEDSAAFPDFKEAGFSEFVV